MKRALAAIVTMTVTLAVAAMQPATATTPVRAAALHVRHVHVGKDAVTIACMGSGKPTVILFAGFGDSHTVWTPIQRKLAHRTRVCSYDRLGEGTSSAPRHVETLASNARLLHRVLHKIHVRGPLVLVGHSLGGDVAAYYAHTHRRSTAGVVMFDATPVGYLQYVLRLIPSTATGLPAALREEAASVTSGDNQERIKLAAKGWAPAHSLGHVPLAVVEHGKDIFAAAGSYGPQLQQRWANGQLRFAKLSWRSQLVIAPRSGHYIYQDQPRLALDVINAVVAES